MKSPQRQARLSGRRRLGPLPMERIRRVAAPTTLVTDAIQRIDSRDTAYGLAERGEYGLAVQKGAQTKPPTKYPLSAAQKEVLDHLARMPSGAAAGRSAPVPSDPGTLTRHLKSLAYFLKADLAACCDVPTSAYYSHDRTGQEIEPRFGHALLVVMRKEHRAIRASGGSDWMGDPISFQAYQHLALVAETIANYLRRLGWEASAQYGPSFVDRYAVLLPPLLLAAGVGEVSRIGILVNPYLGPAFKAAAILTDLPLVPDQPIDFGLQRFCESCRICADQCPSRAIRTGGKGMYNGYETWKLDTQRCASFNFTNKKGTLCNRCVKSCPWSSPDTLPHRVVRELVLRVPAIRPLAVRGAQWLRTGEGHPEDQWWFDMEYEDGALVPR